MPQPVRLTLADFLIWESSRPEKERFEFLDGEIFAFGQGASLEHNELVMRLSDVVRAGKSAHCRSAVGMQRVIAGESATFPDIVLLCDERDLFAPDTRTSRYPKLMQKQYAYDAIPTLEEYLIMDSRERRGILYRRDASQLREMPIGEGTIELASIGARLDLAALYDGIV